MARHDEKTSAGRAKMLSGGDTGDRLADGDADWKGGEGASGDGSL